MLNTTQLSLSLLIILSTYDSLVLPLIRISIADAAVVVFIFFIGITGRGFYQSIWITFISFACMIGANAIIYAFSTIVHGGDFDAKLLISGFLRPALYVILAINLYYGLALKKISLDKFYIALSTAGVVLSLIVMAQFFSYWPPHYHNNPSFGESGRWTLFSEGWRPTGLSNEASFAGIFLALILSLQIYIKNKISLREDILLSVSPYLTLLGCYFTTSRISLILGLLVIVLNLRAKIKLVVIPLSALVIIMFGESVVPDRYLNILAFNGDPSTLERYGSAIAYINAIFSGDYFFGTGYLNGSNIAMKFLDPAVIFVLDDRELPAFSLPLQVLLEFGVPIFLFVLTLLYKKISSMTDPLLFVLLASAITGIQNFVFVYIFISLVIYAKYSLHK